MHRFLIAPSDVSGSAVLITDPRELRHIRTVLRLGAGDRICCFDGSGAEYIGVISGETPSEIRVEIQQERRELTGAAGAPRLWLAQSLLKAERFEWIVEKATELGVARISPLVTARTIVKMSGRAPDRKQQRWERIAREAAKQCGRARVPALDAPQPLDTLLADDSFPPLVLIPTLAIKAPPLQEVLSKGHDHAEALVLIGPEGDFTKEEIAAAIERGAAPVSLGSLTLRAETAAIATLAILGYALPGARHT